MQRIPVREKTATSLLGYEIVQMSIMKEKGWFNSCNSK